MTAHLAPLRSAPPSAASAPSIRATYCEPPDRSLARRWFDRLPVPWVLTAERVKRAVLPAAGYRRTRRLYEQVGRPPCVLGGPFRGMRYVTDSYDSGFLPRLLGTYEWEVADAVARLVASGVDRVVDIGAAEGYYAVGLARLLPPAVRVVGFDSNRRARFLLRRMARLNGVAGRVEVRGHCDPPALADALAGADRPLVVCDCEGFEAILLDPDRVPALRRSAVLVELHDHLCPGASETVRARFAPTHRIEAVPHDPHGPPPPPEAARHGLSEAEWRQATREGRVAAQQWFVMTPAPVPAPPADAGA